MVFKNSYQDYVDSHIVKWTLASLGTDLKLFGKEFKTFNMAFLNYNVGSPGSLLTALLRKSSF